MIPPNTGPRTPAMATTAPANAPVKGCILIGLISGMITKVREYNPDPPIPCSTLKAMSWSSVWANPHPSEKAKKITKAAM